MSDKEVADIVHAVEDKYAADVHLYKGYIDSYSHIIMDTEIAKTRQNSSRKNVILILVTPGGDPNAAYMISRMLQGHYADFIMFAPSGCQSSGTLIAIGAKIIMMAKVSFLGPLDIQLFNWNNIATQKSGLQYKNAFSILKMEAIDFFINTAVQTSIRSLQTGLPISTENNGFVD